MKRIALVGPESSGKTTLTQQLAAHFEVPWVPEYARTYLEELDRPYELADLTKIAQGQLQAEKRVEAGQPALYFCDTNLLVINIWAEVKYGQVPEFIQQNLSLERYDLHLLLKPDIPWEPDPQREHPEARLMLYELYEKALEVAKIPFVVIAGQARLRQAIRAIEAL
ncbi:MAG: AAA family ATPase [Bacteroidota bacterium]